MSDATNLTDVQSRLDAYLQRREKELKEELSYLKTLRKRYDGKADSNTSSSASTLVSRSIKDLTKGRSR